MGSSNTHIPSVIIEALETPCPCCGSKPVIYADAITYPTTPPDVLISIRCRNPHCAIQPKGASKLEPTAAAHDWIARAQRYEDVATLTGLEHIDYTDERHLQRVLATLYEVI